MTVWSVARIADLTRLWAAGLTAHDIGRQLGLSKSAVLGKVHRLDLVPRRQVQRKPIEQSDHPWARPSAPSKLSPEPPISAPVAGEERVLDPLNPSRRARPATAEEYASRGLTKRACAWPSGDPRTAEFRSCGERAVVGKPYCPGHCAAAYVIVRPRGA